MAAFFSQIKYKNGPQNYAQYNKEETVYLAPDSEVRQPRTGVVMQPKPLGGEPLDVKRRRGSPRKAGGLARLSVEPVLRQGGGQSHLVPSDGPWASSSRWTTSASRTPGIGRALGGAGRRLRRARFRRQADDPPDPQQPRLSALVAPEQVQRGGLRATFSHATVRMLSAEQMLDSACRATRFRRSSSTFHQARGRLQVPDGELVHPFLKDFGQPARAEACECERGADSTLEQALQIVGGRTLHTRSSPRTTASAKLLKSGADDATLVDQLFLSDTISLSQRSGKRACGVRTRRPIHRPSAGRRGFALDLAESSRVLVSTLRSDFTMPQAWGNLTSDRATGQSGKILPKCPVGAAIGLALDHRGASVCSLEADFLQIDDGASER